MKAGPMCFFLILVAALGFAAWAFFQNVLVNNRANANYSTRLLFPVVVPILAGLIVSVGYVLRLMHFPGPFLIASLKVKQNLLLLIGASAGLAAAYFLYTLLITINSKSIALIAILNTLLLTLVAFSLFSKMVISKDRSRLQ